MEVLDNLLFALSLERESNRDRKMILRDFDNNSSKSLESIIDSEELKELDRIHEEYSLYLKKRVDHNLLVILGSDFNQKKGNLDRDQALDFLTRLLKERYRPAFRLGICYPNEVEEKFEFEYERDSWLLRKNLPEKYKEQFRNIRSQYNEALDQLAENFIEYYVSSSDEQSHDEE